MREGSPKLTPGLAAPGDTNAAVYRVEYRNLLGEWKPDKRAFSREEAITTAQRIRAGVRRNHPPPIVRQLRTRVRRVTSPPVPPGQHLSDQERWERIEAFHA